MTQMESSVHTVDLEREEPGSIHFRHKPVGLKLCCPNAESFDIAFVRFRDDGEFEDAQQLEDAATCISNARAYNPNGVVVVLFIHGWHHSADWDGSSREGDRHFWQFRNVLARLALRESERHINGDQGRRVIGVFIGWNGNPRLPWPDYLDRIPWIYKWINNASFWNRYGTARGLGRSADLQHTIDRVVRCTKDPTQVQPVVPEPCKKGLPLEPVVPLEAVAQPNTVTQPESPLIFIGHSLGALILESAFLALLSSDQRTCLASAAAADRAPCQAGAMGG